MSNFKKWMILAPLSLILIGAGLSMAIDAAFVKSRAVSGDHTWIWYGTAALVIFNTGMSLLGTSVYYRVKHWADAKEKHVTKHS